MQHAVFERQKISLLKRPEYSQSDLTALRCEVSFLRQSGLLEGVSGAITVDSIHVLPYDIPSIPRQAASFRGAETSVFCPWSHCFCNTSLYHHHPVERVLLHLVGDKKHRKIPATACSYVHAFYYYLSCTNLPILQRGNINRLFQTCPIIFAHFSSL